MWGQRNSDAVAALLMAFAATACGKHTEPVGGSASAPPWASSADEASAPPRPGMVWIPKGTLIVGTPLDKSPRVADAEMAGEQVVMGGFYIDVYPYPNEAGALPKTNVTRDEAKALCEGQGKRLCSEIEIERACKGPDNTMYPYGNEYRANTCGTGPKHAISPNGFNSSCISAFGVSDTHGSVWVWTSSDWGRGTEGLVSLRGGNGPYGEIVGRCANGRGEKPEARLADVGARCCAGAENSFQITLSVDRGEPLKFRVKDKEMVKSFADSIHAMQGISEGSFADDGSPPSSNGKAGVRDTKNFVVERTWTWHPIGNEELLLGAGCTRTPSENDCGVLVARPGEKALIPVAFISTEKWQPTLGHTETPRELYVYGGDDNGAFRKRLGYEWGKMSIGGKQRKKKKGRDYYYD